MTPEERWELTLRTAPNDIRRLLREVQERLSTVDRFMEPRLPDYSPMAAEFRDLAWQAFGRPRVAPADPATEADPDQPAATAFDDYVASET